MITWNSKDYASNSTQQQKWARELIAKLHLHGTERMLDIGCGDGKVTAEIARQLPCGNILGLDSSPAMVAYAKETFPPEVCPNLSFVCGDASKLPFTSEFDVVFSNACLHWVYDHRPVLAGIAGALRPGGRVLLQMGGAGNAAEIMRTVESLMVNERWRAYFARFSFRYGFHAPEEYGVWLREAGLQPLRVELIPKHMEYRGAAAMAGWFRTTWMPYINAVPEAQREQFVAEAVEQYLREHPLTPEGLTVLDMMRLEVEATM